MNKPTYKKIDFCGSKLTIPDWDWIKIKCDIQNFFYDFPGKWWLMHRFHPKHRYNMVHTGFKPGYYDPDDRMAAAVIHEFKKFMANWTKERDQYPWNLDDPCERQIAEREEVKWRGSIDLYQSIKDRDYWDLEDDEATEICCRIIRLRKRFWY